VPACSRDCLETRRKPRPIRVLRRALRRSPRFVLQEHRRAPQSASRRRSRSLERAIARRAPAVELRPGSAHARSGAGWMRCSCAGAYAAGRLRPATRRVTLKPVPPQACSAVTARRLIALGHVEKGGRYIGARPRRRGTVRPGWLEFYLFFAAYLSDDSACRRGRTPRRWY
jgi:hypothetical protein